MFSKLLHRHVVRHEECSGEEQQMLQDCLELQAPRHLMGKDYNFAYICQCHQKVHD